MANFLAWALPTIVVAILVVLAFHPFEW